MSALSPYQIFRLDEACKPIFKAFGNPPYLVGTAAEDKAAYRDVDVRLILEDDHYDRMKKAIGQKAVNFLGIAVGEYLRKATELPIDFQIQRQTEANEKHHGIRNPVGIRNLEDYKGDAYPKASQQEDDMEYLDIPAGLTAGASSRGVAE